MTLFAKWTPRQYTVKFVDVMNQTLVEFTDLKYNASVPTSYVNAISKVGHSYKVFHDQNLTNVWNSQNFTVTEDTVLFVDYTKNDYVLSFETNGGSTVEPIRLKFGSLIGQSHATTKSGYTFKGWFLDAGFTTPVTSETVITENMTIYAQWKEIPIAQKVTLSFETNGGTLIPQHEFQKGSLIGTEYITTKSGHTFEGRVRGCLDSQHL
ncbi:InlB B-repeat-containing protein [Erysipelothrix sp. D19-032]